MKSNSISVLVILVIVAIAALAQEPEDSLGKAGLPPNGYIDTPANFPTGIR